jgi:hypothetical protein
VLVEPPTTGTFKIVKRTLVHEKWRRDRVAGDAAGGVRFRANAGENIYDAYSAVAIGYGTSDRLRDGIFHIAVYAKAVNLGFNDGATLDDPKGVLLGSGNRIRHITIRTADDLKRPEVRSYIRRARRKALADARKLGEPATAKPKGVVSTVKAIYPKKRRPK